jgi:hypothetical protein
MSSFPIDVQQDHNSAMRFTLHVDRQSAIVEGGILADWKGESEGKGRGGGGFWPQKAIFSVIFVLAGRRPVSNFSAKLTFFSTSLFCKRVI